MPMNRISEDLNMTWATASDATEIYFEDTGGHGPALVFQSGFMGIHDIWKYQVAGLKSDFRCITHDNRGYGLSGHPEQSSSYSIEANADDLKAVLDACAITQPFLLVCHSFGSATAIAFALKYPELVKGIMMVAGAAISGDVIRSRGGHADMFAVQHRTPSASLKFFKNLGLEESIALEAGKWSRHVFRHQTAAILDFVPGDALSKISIPVLVTHSPQDVVAPMRVPEGNVGMLPNARLHVLEGLNHFPQTQNPEAVNALIEEFHKQL